MQVSEFLYLSDDVNYIVDELSDARTEATENEVTCEEMYSDCPSKSIMTLLNQLKNISKK